MTLEENNKNDKTLQPESNEEMIILISRLESLMSMVRDTKRKPFQEEAYRERFATIFSPNVSHTDADGKKRNYDELLQYHCEVARNGFFLKILAHKVCEDQKESFKYILRGHNYKEECVVRVQAFVEDGKIVKLVQESLEITKKVAGQVPAKNNKVNIPGFPTEEKIAEKVKCLPIEVNGKLLGAGTDAAPVKCTQQVIKVSLMKKGIPILRRHNGDTLVKDGEGEDYAGGMHFTPASSFLTRKESILLDKNHEPIAMCLQDQALFNDGYTIYGTKPIDEREGRQGEAVEVADNTFYPWFRVRNSAGRIKYRPVYVWDGKMGNFCPFLRALSADADLSVSSTVDVLTCRQREIIILDLESDEYAYGYMREQKQSEVGVFHSRQWEITIAPGVDPVM
jgi:hypothetical protein